MHNNNIVSVYHKTFTRPCILVVESLCKQSTTRTDFFLLNTLVKNNIEAEVVMRRQHFMPM